MRTIPTTRLLTAVAAATTAVGALIAIAPGTAQAAPTGCSDVEVIFARGTFEPAGLGRVGDAFVGALRSRLPDKTVEAYGVAYPASLEFQRAADGVADASNRIQDIAARCPATDIVLGGYSQGAAVNAYVTADAIPAGYALPAGINGPLPPAVADHVAAVALFGKPSNGILNMVAQGAPPIAIGAGYASKTIDLCAPMDPVCQAGSLDRGAHSQYTVNGMTEQAADFAARQLQSV